MAFGPRPRGALSRCLGHFIGLLRAILYMEYNIFLGAADTPDPPGACSQVGPFYINHHFSFPRTPVRGLEVPLYRNLKPTRSTITQAAHMHQRFGMAGVETISEKATLHGLGMPHIQRSKRGVSKLKLAIGLFCSRGVYRVKSFVSVSASPV